MDEPYILLFGQTQTNQTGCQPYNNTSPYGERSLSSRYILVPANEE